MRTEGNCAAGGPASVAGIPLPTSPRATGRNILSDLERAHTPGWRIPTVDPEPEPVAEHRCKACRTFVHDVSARGWCSWCEEQAALAIAPGDTRANTIQPPVAQDDVDEQPVELPDYVLEFAILMRDTEAHDDPAIRAARKVVANAAVKLQQIHRTWLGRQRAATKAKAPKPSPKPRRAPRPPAQRTPKVDQAVIDACLRLYTGEQLSIPQIATRLGIATATVRRHLLNRGVQLRDDRATRSGRGNAKRVDDPDFVRQAAELYVAGASLDEVAKHLHTGQQQVRKALNAAGVQTRPAQPRQPVDGSAALRQRMADAGVTAKQIRAWAGTAGLDVSAVGILPARIVDAYLEQHPTPEVAS